MSEPTEFHAKCPPSYEELVRRLETLEQQVAQMRDVLKSGWIPNPAYEKAEYEHDPVTGRIWPRKP